MTADSKPEWIKGIKDKLDYGWRYQGKKSGIQPDVSIIFDGANAEIAEILAEQGVNNSSSTICFQCGTCSAVCPHTLVTKDNNRLSARRMLHEAQLGLTDFETEEIWLCVTCSSCVQRCPRGVEIMDFMRDLRRIEVGLGVGKIPDSLQRVMTNIASVGNPFGEPRTKRTDWADSVNVRTFVKGMELLYFPGCFPAYDPRARKVARATTNLLEKAKVEFGILGPKESCCGQSVRQAGNESLFQSLAQHNIDIFLKTALTRYLSPLRTVIILSKMNIPNLGESLKLSTIHNILPILSKIIN
jgi:Fe-S oxidoreductase